MTNKNVNSTSLITKKKKKARFVYDVQKAEKLDAFYKEMTF